MDTAVSIRYGGQFVPAEECNELSYLRLGLTCPCCRHPVYWVGSQDRTNRRGTSYSVASHFRHFRALSIEEASACTERVKSISDKERTRNLDRAKRQRYRLFQSWFWQIIAAHWVGVGISGMGSDLSDHDLHVMLLTGAMPADPEDGEEYVYFPCPDELIMINGFHKNVDVAIEAAETAFEMFASFGTGGKFNGSLLKVGDTQITEQWNVLGDLMRERLHRQIVREALEFLGTKFNTHLVKALWFSILGVPNLLVEPEMIDKLVEYPKEQQTLFLYRTIGFIFAAIPWADEFARLSDTEEVPKVESSYTGLALRYLLQQYYDALLQESPEALPIDLFLWEPIPALKGLNFGRDVDQEAYYRSLNQQQYDGGKMMQRVKQQQNLKRRPALGFG